MSTRIWMLVTAIACTAILALGYVLGVAPNLAASAKADSDRAAVEQQNAIYEDELTALITQYKGIDDIRAQLEELQVALPDVDDQANLLDAISLFAANSGVTVASFTQESPVPYGEVGAAGTLIGVPIAVTVTGESFATVMSFVKQLQEGKRLFMVSGYKIGVNGTGTVTIDLAGFAYTLTATSIVAPGTETVDPATPVPTDSATPTP